jgi:hypothetical protein
VLLVKVIEEFLQVLKKYVVDEYWKIISVKVILSYAGTKQNSYSGFTVVFMKLNAFVAVPPELVIL